MDRLGFGLVLHSGLLYDTVLADLQNSGPLVLWTRIICSGWALVHTLQATLLVHFKTSVCD